MPAEWRDQDSNNPVIAALIDFSPAGVRDAPFVCRPPQQLPRRALARPPSGTNSRRENVGPTALGQERFTLIAEALESGVISLRPLVQPGAVATAP